MFTVDVKQQYNNNKLLYLDYGTNIGGAKILLASVVLSTNIAPEMASVLDKNLNLDILKLMDHEIG